MVADQEEEANLKEEETTLATRINGNHMLLGCNVKFVGDRIIQP